MLVFICCYSLLFLLKIFLFSERPEEVHDSRTLYERLKEQKDKKQEEWDEQFKFSALHVVMQQYADIQWIN